MKHTEDSGFSIYSAPDYRSFLNTRLASMPARGSVSRIAKAIGCQHSHISRVLSGQLHLTMEQAFRVAQYFRLKAEEEDYFLKLVEYERCGDAGYKQRLKSQLVALKNQLENFNKRLNVPSLDAFGNSDVALSYYSSWHWTAIHMAVGIPEYQTPRAIGIRLGLSEEFVLRSLHRLKEFGLVKEQRGKWVMAVSDVHLSGMSPLHSVQHRNWQARASLKAQDPTHDGLNYSVVASISRRDFEKVKDLLLASIDDCHRIVRPSPSEELVCLCLDFFRV